MNEKAFSAKRRHPRVKLPPEFRVKARIRLMGKKETHYLQVDNLSMGGASLLSSKKIPIDLKPGDMLEVTLLSKSSSLRCVAKFIQGRVESAVAVKAEDDSNVRIGIEIIGIDEKGRKILADFLKGLSKDDIILESKELF